MPPKFVSLTSFHGIREALKHNSSDIDPSAGVAVSLPLALTFRPQRGGLVYTRGRDYTVRHHAQRLEVA